MNAKSAHTPGPHYALNYAGYICLQNTPHYLNDDNEDGIDLLNADCVGMEVAEANGALYASATTLLERTQELTTRLYNLVNQIDVALHKDPDFAIGFYPGSGLMATYEEARETLKKVIG